ncbi:MAG: dihydropteroate synthase [Myxococcales bacterium]|nr:dihydropteroate synthase [Myxococcales bacterium]
MRMQPVILKCGDRQLVLGQRTFIMGVVNVTPDSFSDGGKWLAADHAIAHGMALAAAGADVLDVGGESTRPGAAPVTAEEECARVLPVIKGLVREGVSFISVDTRHAETARVCLEEGASWVNDVSGGTHDPAMLTTAKNADALVLMHMRGTPKNMQSGEIIYDDVVKEVADYLAERVNACEAVGIHPEKVLLDPGIGFGKLLEHNLLLTEHLTRLQGKAAGILYGPSRKRFLGELTGIEEASKRDVATQAALAVAVAAGAQLVRVHNVEMASEFLKVIDGFYRRG